MPNYIASNLGGIGNSGVYPNSRPQINIGDTISAIAQAYNNTKQGILTRAYMQQQNQRANQQLALEQQHQELEMRAAGWRPADEVQAPQPSAPQSPAQAPTSPITAAITSAPSNTPSAPPPVDASLQGAPAPRVIMSGTSSPAPAVEPSAAQAAPSSPPPASAPSSAAGAGVAPRMTINGRDYVLGTPPAAQREINLRRQMLQDANAQHPGLFTPAELAYGPESDRAFANLTTRAEAASAKLQTKQDRIAALANATDAKGNSLNDQQKSALASDDVLYRNYINGQLNPKVDPIKVHEQERNYDITHPLHDQADQTAKLSDSYITRRIQQLTASQPPKYSGGPRQPGLDFDSAQAQATEEARKLYSPKSKQAAPRQTVQTQDELDYLRSIHMTDAQIKAKYNLAPGLK